MGTRRVTVVPVEKDMQVVIITTALLTQNHVTTVNPLLLTPVHKHPLPGKGWLNVSSYSNQSDAMKGRGGLGAGRGGGQKCRRDRAKKIMCWAPVEFFIS